MVICFAGLFITGKTGGDAMGWHFRFGYTMGSLLLFRIAWGLLGGRWSRFASFCYSPRSVIDYLRGQGPYEYRVGHNPLGAASVLAILVFLLAQVGTGLFSEDKGEAFGPLSMLVSSATVRLVTSYHKGIGQAVLIFLVLLHLAAISFYYFNKKNNLLKPMITGDKLLTDSVEPSRDDGTTRITAAVVFAFCVALMAWLVQFGE
jgi:cytochrome b